MGSRSSGFILNCYIGLHCHTPLVLEQCFMAQMSNLKEKAAYAALFHESMILNFLHA